VNPDVPVVGETLPTYAHPGDAGADLTAAESVTLAARGGRARIRTGMRIAIPDGYAGFVLPRSGLAAKHGITCLNTPGLVDSGYRGELMVVLVNTDPDADYKVEVGDRIAQLVIQRVEQATFVRVDALDDHQRGEGGFGSTGA
jgi:dUTP pyrophosphatase